ncbi:MAG: PKD-like domain-containing protein [Bacteroidota bacterium]
MDRIPDALATNASICNGQTTNISITNPNAVTGVSYIWSIQSSVNVSGASAGSGALINQGISSTDGINQGMVTYSIIPSAAGCVGPTFAVTAIVEPTPSFSFTNPAAVICTGGQTNITLNTPIVGGQVRLQSVTYGAVIGTLIPGVLFSNGQSLTETLLNGTNSPVIVTYVFEAIVRLCGPSAMQSTTVTVNPSPLLTNTATQLQTIICSNVALNFMPTSNVVGTTYSWTTSIIGPITSGVTSGTSTVVPIIDAPINTGNVAGTVTYAITPIAAGCSGITRNYVVIVNPVPNATATNQIICSGLVTGILITNPNAVSGTTYTWTESSTNVTGASAGSGATIAQLLTSTNGVTNGSVIYTITPSANGCVGATFDVTATVKPTPVITNTAPQLQASICSATSLNFIPTSSIVGTTYTWTSVSSGGSITGNALTGSGTITNALANSGSVVGTVTYTITPTFNGCSGSNVNYLVNVLPLPSANGTDVVICGGQVVNIPLDASPKNVIGTTFTWIIQSTSGNVTGTSAGSGSTISQSLELTNTSVGIVVYRVTPSASNCIGPFKDITVTINPPAIVSAGPDLKLCEDIPNIVLTGSIGGSTSSVTWTGGTGSFSDATSVTPSYSFNNPSEINTFFTFTITSNDPDGAGPCTIVSDQMNLQVNPLPIVLFTGFPIGSPPQMAENNLPITLTGNQVGGEFTIQPDSSLIGGTFVNVVDRVNFDPSAVILGPNYVKYFYTNPTTECSNFVVQQVIVNPVTNVNFTIQSGMLNANLEWEVCADQGLVKIIGVPIASTGKPPETQFTADPAYPGQTVPTIVKNGPDYFMDTDGLVSDTYLIRYTYRNAFDAITFKLTPVHIFASPIADFTSSNNCIASDVVFKDTSTINPTPFPTSIAIWQWSFGDGTASTLQDPSKRYTISSTYAVGLKVTTIQGCSNSSPTQPIRVGDVPTPDFGWSAVCNFDLTKFEDQSDPGNISTVTSYIWDFGDGDVVAGQVADPIPPGANGDRTTGIFDKPNHQYVAFGTYNATITVQTNDGCSNSITKKVFILPYSTVTPQASAAYQEDFESNDGGWIAEAGLQYNVNPNIKVLSDTSWIYGLPNGPTINAASSGTNAWWTGRNNSTYYSLENSWMNGPCFNLSALDRPMISLDYWSDLESQLDGVVLQYSLDGGISWFNVGSGASPSAGINWYNSSNIVGKPGIQLIGDYGWSGNDVNGWQKGRFNLDMIDPAKRAQVRIRIAIGSSNDNIPNPTFDGFAFDNVYVGEKQRNVLIEHFTNSGVPVNGETYLNTLYDNQVSLNHLTSDFSAIYYHINSPSPDPLNLDNPSDPPARALFFGVTQPPATIMDGRLGAKGTTYDGTYDKITAVEVDRRALVDPLFDLQLDTIPTGLNNTITVQLTITARQDFTTPLIAHVTLVEDNVGGNRNVLRKLLFGGDGETITNTWVAGQSLVKLRSDVEIDVPVANSDNLRLVAFVQDKNDIPKVPLGESASTPFKEIYQSVNIKAPRKTGSPVVGIVDKDPAPPTTLNGIRIFPNPANGSFNFELPEGSASGFTWKLADQRGVVLQKGDFDDAFNNRMQVDISGVANGVYFVIIAGPGKSIVYQKLVIMNRN